MKFHVLSLFPDVIEHYCNASIIGRGQQHGLIHVQAVNPRDFSNNKHNRVDEPPYGGGAGMVMMAPPLVDAYESLLPLPENTPVIFTTPAGPTFNQTMAKQWAHDYSDMVFLCGHYEGMDHRVTELIPNVMPISIGDFVLTGGELPALCMMDAISRYIPGVVQKMDSVENDSFSGESTLLEHPHYTRPAEYRGLTVPDVLLSGDHARIAQWRHQQSLQATQQHRPELLDNHSVAPTPEKI